MIKSRSVVFECSNDKKSNSVNTLYKFIKPEVEYVTQLNFYDPNAPTTTIFTTLRKPSRNLASSKTSFNSKLAEIETYRSSPNINGMMNIRRLENVSYETTLESNRKEIEDKRKVNKIELKRLFKQLGINKRECDDLEIHVEFLGNFYKYTGFDHKYSVSLLKKNQESEDYLKLIHMKKILDMEADKRDEELKRKKVDLVLSRAAINELKEMIDYIKESNRILKEDLDVAKNSLLIHYHRILTEGKDTRKEGLVWLIKAIWNLGYRVIPSYLPRFLDERAIAYLFNYAAKDIEMIKIKKSIDEVRLLNKIRRDKKIEQHKRKAHFQLDDVNAFGSTQQTFKTGLNSKVDSEAASELYDSFKEIKTSIIQKLLNKQKKENNMYEEKLTMQKIKDLMSQRGELNEDAIEYIKAIQSLEVQLKNIQIALVTMKKAEVDRINKEYYSNDYQRRFNVKQEDMISALIGEDNTSNEMTRLKRDQKKYFQELLNLRTYNTLQKR